MASRGATYLPNDVRSTAFRAFTDAVRRDQDVRRLSVMWKMPDDADWDQEPPKAGIIVRFWPKLLPMDPVAVLGNGVRSFLAPVQVDMEMRIPSYVWDDQPNVIGFLIGATAPSNANYADVAAKLFDAGIAQLSPTVMPTMFGPDEVVTATFVLTCYITV